MFYSSFHVYLYHLFDARRIVAIVREYVFYVFFQNPPQKRDFLRFLKCHFKKT